MVHLIYISKCDTLNYAAVLYTAYGSSLGEVCAVLV